MVQFVCIVLHCWQVRQKHKPLFAELYFINASSRITRSDFRSEATNNSACCGDETAFGWLWWSFRLLQHVEIERIDEEDTLLCKNNVIFGPVVTCFLKSSFNNRQHILLCPIVLNYSDPADFSNCCLLNRSFWDVNKSRMAHFAIIQIW
jgi:hypothetical protein